jgi:hypothetical protein
VAYLDKTSRSQLRGQLRNRPVLARRLTAFPFRPLSEGPSWASLSGQPGQFVNGRREFELGHILFGLTNLRVMKDRRNDRYYDSCVSLIVDFVSHFLRILSRPAKNYQAKRSNFDHSGSRAVVVAIYSSR